MVLFSLPSDSGINQDNGESLSYEMASEGNGESLLYEMASEDNGESLLYEMASEGNLAVVQYLLQNNADVNQATRNGSTPYWIAKKNGHSDVVTALLSCGQEVDVDREPVDLDAFIDIYMHNQQQDFLPGSISTLYQK